MTNNQKLSDLAHAVQSSQERNSVVELVYNETTGQFEPSVKGAPVEGTIVTQMTKEGFA
ncbi:MAG: hypothetical protein IJ650_07185 [Paludibacteraceae bacterium]|nr:hypothetical protein [Paludibacteraceae bacterium]